MRRHASELSRALEASRTSELSEEQLEEFTNLLVTSFKGAQGAWEEYREHLRGHGVPLAFAPAEPGNRP
jgi:hypothetical protein